MKRASVILIGVILIVNIANALGEVAYRTVRVGDLDIFYREAGPKDGPTILLLHGLPSSSHMYQRLLESDLARQYHPRTIPALTFVLAGSQKLCLHLRSFGEGHAGLYGATASGSLHPVHAGLRGPDWFSYGLGSSRKSSGDDHPKCRLARRGLSPLWAVRRSFWQDRPAHEAEVRSNLLSLEATRKRHVGTSPDPAQYDPDLWVDEVLLPEPAGTGRYSAGSLLRLPNNLKSYPKWQQWLRDNKPPLLVLWGRYDTLFTVAGGEAYKKDNPRAEVHILDAGHFAPDLKPEEIIRLTQDFMARQGRN